MIRKNEGVPFLETMISKKVKAVAFDMDGTLFNSFSVSYDAIREGFQKFWSEIGVNGPTPSWENIKVLIGLPSYMFFPAALPETYRDQWKLLHKFIGEAEHRRLTQGHGRTFDGVHETLAVLKARGYSLALLSNASRVYFDSILDSCDLRKYFSKFSYLGEDPARNKAHVLLAWVKGFGGADRIIYVGDRKADIDASHAAGIKAVGVTWGYGNPVELKDSDWIIDSMPDLLNLLVPIT